MIHCVILFAVLLISSQAADYTHIGCYKDTNDRALRYGPQQPGYNIETCSVACLDYKYFALQAGSWCFCDNDYDHATKTYGSATNCPSNQLGGSWANDVFHHYKHIGCYADTNNRALRYGPQQPNYNIASCSSACAAYKYFALQAGGWCFCDNDFAHATIHGPATNCPSNQLGGSWANDVFQNSNGWIVLVLRASVSDEDDWPAGDSDPYIKITGHYCENVPSFRACTTSTHTQMIRTSTKHGTNNPVWNEQLDFGDSSRYYTKFVFDAFDEDGNTNNDDSLGWSWKEVGYTAESLCFGWRGADCRCGLHQHDIGCRKNINTYASITVKINNPLERPLCDC